MNPAVLNCIDVISRGAAVIGRLARGGILL